MDCKEFEKLIPDFIDRKLDYKTLNRFYRHREECDSCREELDIQFLVSKGMQKLEEGDSFDLKKDLENYLSDVENDLKIHRKRVIKNIVFETISVIIVIAGVLWILF
ncbi:MAG: zf-HC2 domain-containing protein [Acetatifactor sp.]|nr:zf-HC2 domain-containing protein [Acetatifactor sp.]